MTTVFPKSCQSVHFAFLPLPERVSIKELATSGFQESQGTSSFLLPILRIPMSIP